MKLAAAMTRRARGAMFVSLVRVRPRDDLMRLGSTYGGWTVPTELIGPGAVCYCAGVGEDITFDVALIERFGAEVFAFDPTPRAVTHVQGQPDLDDRFHFEAVGVWREETELRFYEPADPSHVSHSVVNLQQTAGFFTARCETIPGLMRRHGHDALTLLKLDVEGAEHAALEPVLSQQVRVQVICVEFDQPSPLRDVLRTCRALQRAGFDLVARMGWDCTFVRKG